MKTKRIKKNKVNRFWIVFPILSIIGIGFVIILSSSFEKKWLFNWKEIRTEIKDSIQIAELRGITNGIGGNGVSTQDEVSRRSWIMKNAKQSELLKLIEYPNGTVKAIAYEGLLRKKDFKNKMELILKTNVDTIYPVYIQTGCLGSKKKLNEYLIQNVLMFDDQIIPYKPELIFDFGFSDLEKQKILNEFRNKN